VSCGRVSFYSKRFEEGTGSKTSPTKIGKYRTNKRRLELKLLGSSNTSAEKLVGGKRKKIKKA